MGTIHIADAKAARDFMGVLAQVKAGNEVVVESETTPAAVLRPPKRQGRTIEKSIAILEARETERGYASVTDEELLPTCVVPSNLRHFQRTSGLVVVPFML